MQPTPGKAFSARPLIRTVYAPSLLHAAGYGMLGPAIPLFAKQLDVPLALIGLLVAVQGIGAVLADIPAGLVTSRAGGRRTMSLGIGISAAAAVALGISRAPAHLFVAVPLLGIGLATWATSRLTYVAEVAPVEQRGRALALVGGASRVGMTLGPILGGVLGERFGLETTFFGHAVLAAVALALTSTSRRERAAQAPLATRAASPRVLRTVMDHRRELATAGSVALSLVMVRSARRLLIPLWGLWLGLDLAEIGLVIGLASAVDMTLFYPVGVVMDRWGRKWTIVPCLGTLALSLALIPFTHGFGPFLLVGLLGGLGNGLGSGAVMTLGADLAPPERGGEFLGVWRLISDSGGILAPAIIGGLAQLLSLGAAFFAASGIGLVGALLMAVRVREALVQAKDGVAWKEPDEAGH